MPFLTALSRTDLPSGEEYVLERPLVYQGQREKFIVPAGFTTDLASVPKFLWWILPPFGRHSRAAVLHDWLYTTAPEIVTAVAFENRLEPGRALAEMRGVCGQIVVTKQRAPITRKNADRLFRRAMRNSGVSNWRSNAMYLGVRLGGRRAWNRCRDHQECQRLEKEIRDRTNDAAPG